MTIIESLMAAVPSLSSLSSSVSTAVGGAAALPHWLRAGPQPQLQQDAVQHVTERRETCHVQTTPDGFRVLRCTETRELLRQCADGHREVIEHTTSTTVRPYEPCSVSSSSSSSAGRGRWYDDPSVAPAVSATLGQMLEDFFVYASELQQNLEQQGVDVAAAAGTGGWHEQAPSTSSSISSISSSSSSSPQTGLFSWWQLRRWLVAASQADGGPTQQVAGSPGEAA